jgi:hypothetical protein
VVFHSNGKKYHAETQRPLRKQNESFIDTGVVWIDRNPETEPARHCCNQNMKQEASDEAEEEKVNRLISQFPLLSCSGICEGCKILNR